MPDITSSRQKAIQERIQAHKISESEYRVYNPTNHSSYSVLRTVSGTWYCTCPFALKGNHLRNGSECKHLRRVLDRENGCGKGSCREGKLCASCKFDEEMSK